MAGERPGPDTSEVNFHAWSDLGIAPHVGCPCTLARAAAPPRTTQRRTPTMHKETHSTIATVSLAGVHTVRQ